MQRDMTEPLGGSSQTIDWPKTCDELLTTFNTIAKDLPPNFVATKLTAFREQLVWALEHAPVADDARYRAPTAAIGGKATY